MRDDGEDAPRRCTEVQRTSADGSSKAAFCGRGPGSRHSRFAGAKRITDNRAQDGFRLAADPDFAQDFVSVEQADGRIVARREPRFELADCPRWNADTLTCDLFIGEAAFPAWGVSARILEPFLFDEQTCQEHGHETRSKKLMASLYLITWEDESARGNVPSSHVGQSQFREYHAWRHVPRIGRPINCMLA